MAGNGMLCVNRPLQFASDVRTEGRRDPVTQNNTGDIRIHVNIKESSCNHHRSHVKAVSYYKF